MRRKIDISHRTIIFTLIILLGIWLLYQILNVILLIFVAIIMMSALAPIIETLTEWKIPKPLAILLVYLLVVVGFVAALAAGFTPVIDQTGRLSQRLVENGESLLQFPFVDKSILNNELAGLSHNAISYTFNIVEGFVSLVSILVMSFYLLLDRTNIENHIASLFLQHQAKVHKLLTRIELKLGAWLRGQFLLSLIVAVVTYAGLIALGVDFALPLAIIVGLMEVIPVIGPIISAIPAILIALTVSPLQAALVTVLYIFIQQVESHVIVPQVMKRAVGLNPLLVIIAIAVGGKLLGFAGAILAVPIAVVIQVVAEELLEEDDLPNL